MSDRADVQDKSFKAKRFSFVVFALCVFFPTVNSRWVWLKKKREGNIVTWQNKLRKQALAEWWWWS